MVVELDTEDYEVMQEFIALNEKLKSEIKSKDAMIVKLTLENINLKIDIDFQTKNLQSLRRENNRLRHLNVRQSLSSSIPSPVKDLFRRR